MLLNKSFICLHVHTTNITSFLRRQNVLFMSFVTMSLCSYFASVNQVYCAFQNILQTGRIWKYRFLVFAWTETIRKRSCSRTMKSRCSCDFPHQGFLTVPFNNMRTPNYKIQRSMDKTVFRYCQLNVRRLLPASDYCRARGNQFVGRNSDNETFAMKQCSVAVGNWKEPPNNWSTVEKTHLSVELWILESAC